MGWGCLMFTTILNFNSLQLIYENLIKNFTL